MQWVVPLSILIFFEAIADILAKEWQGRGGVLFAALSLAGYLVANSFWLFALRNGSGLARGGIIFSVSSAVLATTIGVFLYQEAINPAHAAGIGLGILSIVLLSL